ncbi:MAG: hypothetical protein NZ959_08490 [Armatimonadetes bacterium]|nr:hypothetical protein [Armatimonadota bacterium]MDW8122444.1 hypothetical protein [Armatimonadota bacterium]
MRLCCLLVVLLLTVTCAVSQSLNLLGKPADWQPSVDRGGTKMQVSSRDGILVIDVTADGDTEDYPKIRRAFPKAQDWRSFARIRAKVRVTCDDPNVLFKPIALVFYDEQTRLPDHPDNPMRQQVIWRSLPVGRWMEIVEWLTEIRRSTIRQFDLYLYEAPPATPHKFRWEVAQLELEQLVAGKTVVFDGDILDPKKLKGEVSPPVGRVTTDDGLELVFGKGGEILQVLIDKNVLGSSLKTVPTGLLVRDLSRPNEPPQMIRGKVTQKGPREVHQQSKRNDLGLEVSATYRTLGDWLEISGRIADVRQQDRAIIVYFALPVAKGQWQWWDSMSAYRTKPDATGELHYLERRMDYGFNGSHSKYPLGALTLPGKGGLTLAIRMDEPAVHRIVYNPSLGLFYIAIDFGLIPEKRIDGSPLWEAPFRFLVYRHNPDWGFRSALQRYYEFFPQFFKVRVKRQGGWYVWGNMADTEGALEAGFVFHWGPGGEKAVQWDNQHGTLALLYIEPQTYQQSHQDFQQQPTLTDAINRLRKLAQGDREELERVANTHYRVYPLAHTDEDLHQRMIETAQVVLRSLNYNAFGQPNCLISRPPWMQNQWGAIFSCNLSPALPDGKGRFNIHRVLLPALEAMEKAGARYDGLALDSLGAYGDLHYINTRREHFRYSRLPLSFSAIDHKPAQVAFFTTVEWLREIASMAEKRGLVLMANCSWSVTPGWLTFAAPYLDIFGAEHPYFVDPDFIRAIAFRKPCTDLPYDPRPEWEVAWHLLHGIFPGHGNDLPLLRRYTPLLQAVTKAGWEPITGARIEPDVLRLERFGNGRQFYLVVHNPTEKPVNAQVTVDTKVMKVGKFSATLLPDNVPLDVKGNAFHLNLSQRNTVVVSLKSE